MNDNASSEIENRKKRLAVTFDRASATYDRVGPRFFTYYGRRLVESAQLRDGARVLDIASGRGAVLFPAAERIGPAGSVTGIDLSEDMVKATADEIRARGLRNAEVRQMDAEQLQFSDASFDFVLGGFCLFFFPQLSRALSEMRRVLKPDGRIAVSTWGKEDAYWPWLDALLKAHLPPEPEPVQSTAPPSGPDFETPQGMEAILREAGFADIQVVAEAGEFIYTTEEEWWATQWSHAVRSSLEKIERDSGPEALAKFKAEAFDKLQAFKKPDGIHHVNPALFTLARNPAK